MPRKELVVLAREGLSLMAKLLAEFPRLLRGLVVSLRANVASDPSRDSRHSGLRSHLSHVRETCLAQVRTL